MANRDDRSMPAEPDRGSGSDDPTRATKDDERFRGVGESDDDEFEETEDLEEDDEEEDGGF